MDKIRAFIAIELPENVRQLLAHWQAQLRKAQDAPVKWVAPYGIHLTLQFLGAAPVAAVADITGAVQRATQGTGPFPLTVTGLGVFPHLNRVQVVWVGLGGNTEILLRLQKNIADQLAPLGFPPENRPFTPHLTLGRVRNEASLEERRLLGEAVTRTSLAESASFTVTAVSLMQSELTREGARYHRVSSVKLNEVLPTLNI